MDRVRQPPPNPRGLSPSPLPAKGRQGAAPAISGTFQILKGAQPPPEFRLSGGSPLTFDSYPSSPGGQLHRSSSGCGLPQAVMAGRRSLLSFGFSSNRAQQAAGAGNSGSLPLDPAPNSDPGEIPGLEGSQSPSGPSEQPSGQLDQPHSSPSHLESEQQSQQQFDDFFIDAPGQCLISGREQSMPNMFTLVKAGCSDSIEHSMCRAGLLPSWDHQK